MKATAIAPSNIALVKYWGKKDEKLKLPANGSLSINLSGLYTKTTVEFDTRLREDVVILNGTKSKRPLDRIITHINLVRSMAKVPFFAKVVSENNFPIASGLASSASNFAALSLAAATAANLKLSQKELSILARIGSGSACRSIPDGFVEWLDGNTNDTSYAISLYPPDYWDLAIIAVVLSEKQKEITSTQGQIHALKSPFFNNRIERIPLKIKKMKNAIKKKQFTILGEMIESEALELHAIALSSTPPIIYWEPETVRLLKLVQTWRKAHLPVYFTIDAGPNIFLICQKQDLDQLKKKLLDSGIKKYIVNVPSKGARIVSDHLF